MRRGGIFAVTIAVLSFGIWVGVAQASIISATPNASIQGSGYQFDLANGAADFTFSDTGQPDNAAVAIQTGGDARIYSAPFSDGDPSTYIAGTGGFVIDNNFANGTFESFSQPTAAPFSRGDTFYVLGLVLGDGLHYGYARTDNNILKSFGYESVAGQGIHTGAKGAPEPSSEPVPEPSVLGILALGLALVWLGLVRREKQSGSRSLAYQAD